MDLIGRTYLSCSEVNYKFGVLQEYRIQVRVQQLELTTKCLTMDTRTFVLRTDTSRSATLCFRRFWIFNGVKERINIDYFRTYKIIPILHFNYITFSLSGCDILLSNVWFQKLNQNENQELAKNYFKTSRAEELLNRTCEYRQNHPDET